MNKINLGECPFCNSINYTRNVRDWNEDFCSLECACNDCENYWTEYFQLEEVKFDKEGEEFIYNNCLSKEEKAILLKAINLLIETENDTKDYSRIINVLEGNLNEE